MFKSAIVGIGIFLAGLGLSLHAIDSYTVHPKTKAEALAVYEATPVPAVVTPPPWKPWAYLGAGIVIILWSATLPQRMGGKG